MGLSKNALSAAGIYLIGSSICGTWAGAIYGMEKAFRDKPYGKISFSHMMTLPVYVACGAVCGFVVGPFAPLILAKRKL